MFKKNVFVVLICIYLSSFVTRAQAQYSEQKRKTVYAFSFFQNHFSPRLQVFDNKSFYKIDALSYTDSYLAFRLGKITNTDKNHILSNKLILKCLPISNISGSTWLAIQKNSTVILTAKKPIGPVIPLPFHRTPGTTIEDAIYGILGENLEDREDGIIGKNIIHIQFKKWIDNPMDADWFKKNFISGFTACNQLFKQ